MPVIYNALDNEFAAASGSNVNIHPDYSYFDYPPNSTNNLTISSNKDDDDPSLFELGDTYDLTWTGNGGGGAMADAVVIRSDYLGPGEGAIVFEGINDTTGELYQVVWTPGFDLESWYWDNGGGPSSPNAFWTSDQDGSTTVQYVCFGTGTRIAVPGGNVRAVESLAPGDLVHTRDHGAQPLLRSTARVVFGVGRAAPVVFDAGSIGNTDRLVLSQTHRVMLAAPEAELHFGAPEVLVPAKALVNNSDIRIEQRRRIGYHHLLLAAHEVLSAEGAACESLLAAPAALARIADAPLPSARARPMRAARPVLSYREARLLARLIGLVPADLPAPIPAILIAA